MSEEQVQDTGVETGASSSEVKEDVTPTIPTHDDRNVPYYNRFREMEDKFKDVDLDLYKRAKDFNFDEAEEALEFKNLAYSDQGKLSKIIQILKGEAAAATEAGKGSNSPEMKAIMQEISAVKQYIQSQNQSSWMKEYDSSVTSSLSNSLKDESFKELGGNLTEFEKRAVSKFVDDAFQADAAKGRFSKLSVQDVPQIVQGVLKMVLDHRKGSLGGMIKKDSSPEAMRGSGANGKPAPKPMSDEERMSAMIAFKNDSDAGRIPAV